MSVLTLFIFMAVPLLWTVASLLFINPLFPRTAAEMQETAQYLWDNPQSEDDFFERPGIREKTETEPEMVCFGIYVKNFPWLEVRVNGKKIENLYRYQLKSLTRGKNGRFGPPETECFVMPPYVGLALLEVRVQDSLIVFMTHQWAVQIKPIKGKSCLAVSLLSSNCF